jgi:hypothetical protein
MSIEKLLTVTSVEEEAGIEIPLPYPGSVSIKYSILLILAAVGSEGIMTEENSLKKVFSLVRLHAPFLSFVGKKI